MAQRLGPLGVATRLAAGGALLAAGISTVRKEKTNALGVVLLSAGAVGLLEGMSGYCPIQDAIVSSQQ